MQRPLEDRRPLRICQLSSVDFAIYHFLTPLMNGMRDAGHEVVAVCRDGALVQRIRDEGFRVRTVPIERSYNVFRHIRAYRQLVDLFRRERFDVVHVHTPIASLVGRFAAWRAGVRLIVYTAHGFYFHENMSPVSRAVFVLLEWLAGRLTDVLMTQSAEDGETARRLRLCRTGLVHVIGNGVDPARFRPAASAEERRGVRRAVGTADDDTVVIVMLGRLVAEKGYPELFAAMRTVAAAAELWVIGERLVSDHAHSIDAEIEAVRADPELGRRVRFLGYRDDVAQLLRGADVFTLPSHREGMPRSIIEAMMTGLPVVATNIRGIREEVVPDETGLLVPVSDVTALGDALARVVSDRALRQRLGCAARERALSLYRENEVVSRQLEILGLAGRP